MYLQLEQTPQNYDVRMPLIGSGIGGLDPVRAAHIIRDVANSHESSHLKTSLFLLSSDTRTGKVLKYLMKENL